jgi:type II secretory pathway pseudopilin PulG
MNRSDSGFALVEAVVALGIMAVILGATFQTIAMARGAIAAADERRVAMLEAQSLVAQLGATISLVPGSSSGQSDTLHWRVDNEAVGNREIEAPLIHSVVLVTDEHERVLARLETLRLAR